MVVSEKESILVVDDAPQTLEVISRNLSSEGYKVFTAEAVADAVKILDSTPVDLVITDFKMPKTSGLDLVRHVRENLKDTEVMMVTGFATVDGAVDAVKAGAEEYLSKPFTDEELLEAVRRSLEKLQLRKAGQLRGHRTPEAPEGILGESDPMRRTFGAIAKVAGTDATVLISGESGTGKELVSRAIHYSSPRASAPFIPVNCGGIPETLLESALFGHIKGAFTGATVSRAGFFQAADGGTIFLDEIGNTSLSMQAKLLRVLEDNEIFMVGSSKPHTVDVRVLAATNRGLQKLVEKSAFRDDLFYRLNVINIAIAPLRERGDDVLLLARHFVAKFAEEQGKPAPEFSDKALRVLKSYEWPGNVRELKNVINRLVVMSDESLIDVPDLPELMRFSALRETGLNRTLAEVEVEHVRNVLASVDGNKTRAAEILGIDRKTLREKLKSVSSRGDSPH
jgi:DNA-binding NtrC family response regulator